MTRSTTESRKKTAPKPAKTRMRAASKRALPSPAIEKRSEPAASQVPSRPGGKLGLIVDRLATAGGATADELAAATGWQKHTVLGALSRLRSRGFALRLDAEDGRKAYRLERRAD